MNLPYPTIPRTLRDEQLVESYQDSNDHELFETLYNRYAQKVFQKCLSLTKDSEVAQDFTQDIFIKVFNKIDTFEKRSTFSTWLYSITRNYCLDQMRVSKRLGTESLSTEVQNRSFNSEDTAFDERIEEMEAFLNALPADEVMMLKLKYEQNRTIKELAEQYNLTESAVKMRLKRTRDRLQQYYMAHYHQA
jgi:RNA polymerase sigma-70 factor (ECF subfamily)